MSNLENISNSKNIFSSYKPFFDKKNISSYENMSYEKKCNSQELLNSLQESDFPTEERRRKLIKDSFKIDENRF